MINKLKIKIILILISTTIIGGYVFISFNIGNDKYKDLKHIISTEKVEFVKRYIFPYRFISQQEQIISKQDHELNLIKDRINWSGMELQKEKEGSEIVTEETVIKLLKFDELKKYTLKSGFYAGIWNDFPGSGYIDFHEGNIIALSTRGVLVFKKNIEDVEENFK